MCRAPQGEPFPTKLSECGLLTTRIARQADVARKRSKTRRPSKVAFLADHAWRGGYSLAEIGRWLEVFVERFFALSQFKRSCLPNGPKVGSGGSLSPRSDWRAPADAEAEVWLRELRDNIPGSSR